MGWNGLVRRTHLFTGEICCSWFSQYIHIDHKKHKACCSKNCVQKNMCLFFFLYPVLESKRLKGWLIYQFGFALVDIQLG